MALGGQPATPPEEASAQPRAPASAESGGERRRATFAVFVVSGQPAMGEALDPVEAEGIMSRITDEAMRVVEHHGQAVVGGYRTRLHAAHS